MYNPFPFLLWHRILSVVYLVVLWLSLIFSLQWHWDAVIRGRQARKFGCWGVWHGWVFSFSKAYD